MTWDGVTFKSSTAYEATFREPPACSSIFSGDSPPHFLIRLVGRTSSSSVQTAMRFTVHAFLLVLFALVAITGNVASATESNRLDVLDGRMLRVTEPTNVDSVETEDRSLTTLLKEKAKTLITNAKIKAWLAFGKSDDQVMKALGIQKGLSRAKLEAHPKFKTFEKFQVNKWIKEGASTSKVWDDLGFKNVLGHVESADGFGTYEKFVKALAQKVYKYTRKGGKQPKLEPIVDDRAYLTTKQILEKAGYGSTTVMQVLKGATLRGLYK